MGKLFVFIRSHFQVCPATKSHICECKRIAAKVKRALCDDMCVVCSCSLDNFKFPMLVSISCLLKITKAFVRILEDIV